MLLVLFGQQTRVTRLAEVRVERECGKHNSCVWSRHGAAFLGWHVGASLLRRGQLGLGQVALLVERKWHAWFNSGWPLTLG